MDENEVFENYHFIMVKRLLMVMCIWPYQNKTLKFYGRALIIFAVHTMMIPQSGTKKTETNKYFFVFTPQVVPAIFDVIWPLNESRHKMICYYAEYFVDQDEYLHILVLHTFVVIGITAIIIVAVDTSYMTIAYHVLGYFNLLDCRLKQLNEWENNNSNGDDEQLHHFVIDTIKIHKKTLYFADTVRFTYNENQFFTFGLAVAFLAVGAIDVLANLANPEVIFRIGFIWFGLVAYLFFVNWPGQCFLDGGDDFLHYDCNWYQLPKKTQFLLRFMMMRCLIPCQLIAGPLLQINFANCGVILRTAMSYFAAVTSLS